MFKLRLNVLNNAFVKPGGLFLYKSEIVTNLRYNSIKTFNVRYSNNTDKKLFSTKWILLVIPVASFGLGCWQVQRRQWKLNLLQMLNEKSKAPPRELPTDFSELSSLEYSPIKVRGTFLHDRELYIGPRSLIENGGMTPAAGSLATDTTKNNGWLVITPFQLHDRNEIILINRGWVPTSIKHPSKRLPGQIKEEVELVGLVRLTEKHPPFIPKNRPHQGQWFYRDLDEISEITGSSSVWLDVKGVENMPSGWPIPNQTRITLRNEHMSYLITWFSLSAATSFMWFRQFIQKLPLL